MALSTSRFHNPLPLSSHPSLSLLRRRLFSASLAQPHRHHSSSTKLPWDDPSFSSAPTPTPSAPWIQRWAPPSTPRKKFDSPDPAPRREESGSIGRIVHRLRNLGLDKDEEGGDEVVREEEEVDEEEVRLGDLLERSWNRPDASGTDSGLPWERDEEVVEVEEEERGKRRRVRAPSLAELTLEDSELRRLRTAGIALRERMTVPKAGVTKAIVEQIHNAWRKSELVRLKFHETLAHDMRTAHEIVERRTGGLVIWRAGSVMVVYRGSTYVWPPKLHSFDDGDAPTEIMHEGHTVFIPDVSQSVESTAGSGNSSSLQENKNSLLDNQPAKISEEEAEYNSLLDGLGPRFLDWWGTGFFPVDADLLPQNIPGYRSPFRLLPTGMRARLTNAELTNLRKLARQLPCHFALGRNKNHQGLAAAIVQLWEKSLVVKIAVKRGVQNTNNKLMADELKKLTGGILLQRNKYYIVIYRGKDFLPTSVAAALAEREELTKDIQEAEDRTRASLIEVSSSPAKDLEGRPHAGTLAEFQEAQARWGREISSSEREKMKKEASQALVTKFIKRIEHKLSLAQAKQLRAERLLAKVEASMVPVGPSDDQETITDEERTVFRRIGLRMKAYLPLGIRGVFDGVIENMHLHWKHRELVKLISKQKTLSFVEDTARLLEYESGGILVAIEKLPKGYALIYYRGKNYRRPINIRPRNLLTKAKALKRSIGMQRHEALSQHISELERTIEQYKLQLENSDDVDRKDNGSGTPIESDSDLETSKIEQEDDFSFESEDEDDDDDFGI